MGGCAGAQSKPESPTKGLQSAKTSANTGPVVAV